MLSSPKLNTDLSLNFFPIEKFLNSAKLISISLSLIRQPPFFPKSESGTQVATTLITLSFPAPSPRRHHRNHGAELAASVAFRSSFSPLRRGPRHYPIFPHLCHSAAAVQVLSLFALPLSDNSPPLPSPPRCCCQSAVGVVAAGSAVAALFSKVSLLYFSWRCSAASAFASPPRSRHQGQAPD
ncbi:hypothetical protein SASPL_133344 [Salvia splendens]|uniref:Uncharacterized protein n=1 Tax=Salvia splendens TaxID=180675 RepID=A0A8X8X155_SALSN|nr:hypothetical protein SASPL_133343 [Salvia splendens]KAG6405750.1 hypothetical protein SASPL_133344 [Salvia splendens]